MKLFKPANEAAIHARREFYTPLLNDMFGGYPGYLQDRIL